MQIEDILDEARVPFLHEGHHHCRPGWIQLDCPFCGKDTQRYHMGWNLTLNYANCWKCGGHSAYHTLRELGLSHSKADEVSKGLTVSQECVVPDARGRYVEPDYVGPMMSCHKEYLRKRDFYWRRIAELWDVQGIGISVDRRMSYRLFIPIYLRGRKVSWTSRTISPTISQRYISASAEQEAVNHKHLVYGQDQCSHSIVVVEGPMDAWKVGPGAGALFGTSFTTAQVKLLVQHPYRYVVFDQAKTAQRRAEELCDQLSAFGGTTQNIVLDAEDPGSASRKEIRLLRKAAKL